MEYCKVIKSNSNISRPDASPTKDIYQDIFFTNTLSQTLNALLFPALTCLPWIALRCPIPLPKRWLPRRNSPRTEGGQAAPEQPHSLRPHQVSAVAATTTATAPAERSRSNISSRGSKGATKPTSSGHQNKPSGQQKGPKWWWVQFMKTLLI